MSGPPVPDSPPPGDPDSAWWWAALAEGRVLLPRCTSCGRFRFPPMPSCPFCGADGPGEPVEASPVVRIYSWVVVERALDPAFAGDVPYTVLTVEFDEGPRMFGRLVGENPPAPEAGARVRAVPYHADGRVLLGFEAAG